MAELIENNKGFKIIKVSLEEVFNKFKGLGLCDRCISNPKYFFYIPVMHSCYCPLCYQEWIKKAVNYPEDRTFENKAFDNAKKLLNIK